MKYDDIRVVSIIESILFAYSDPLSIKDLTAVFEKKGEKLRSSDIKKALIILEEKYQESSSGLRLIKIEDKYQIGTRSDNFEYVSILLNPVKKKSLTQASLETLSIIAYKQPATKIEVENIRGVKSDKAVATLIEAGLIEEAGRLDKIGRPIIYRTTDKFLLHFGLDSIRDLPVIKEE